MIEPGDASWIGLGAATVATEAFAVLAHKPAARLRALLVPVVQHPIGRLVLFGCWAFIGFHFFARSGIAP